MNICMWKIGQVQLKHQLQAEKNCGINTWRITLKYFAGVVCCNFSVPYNLIQGPVLDPNLTEGKSCGLN